MDKKILERLVEEMITLGQQMEHEEYMRSKYPALQEAWEKYQVLLALTMENTDGE